MSFLSSEPSSSRSISLSRTESASLSSLDVGSLRACFVLMLAVTGWMLLASTASAEESRPNVVLILVDDLGLHDIGIEGSKFHQTPHIDALAERGMRFTAGYANCRVCSPSRASIQLGQYTARHGITDWIGAASGKNFNRGDELLPAEYVRELPAEDVTLPEALREAGYTTFFAGKWHLGGDGSLPTDHGFDINIGGHHRGSPPGGFFAPFKNPLMEDGPDGESLTRRLGKDTASFIEQQGDKPYFAMLSFYAVHGPIQTSQELWQKYRESAPPAPADGNRFLVDRTLPVRQIQDNPVYAGMMETLDNAVGDVMKAVEASGKADNTLVIFTGDNGGVSSGDAYSTSNLPHRGGKGRQWEGGLREPYYVSMPARIAAGSTSDVPVMGSDFYPTILDVCGLPLRPEQHKDGDSLETVLIEGEDPSLHDRALVWHYPHYGNQGGEPSSIIRVGEYKLIHYHLGSKDELYHLPSDIGEQNDLASQQPERVAKMREQLMAYLKSVDAKFPEPDPRFDPEKAKLRWAKIQGPQKERLEKREAAMLQPNWQPNPTWWGSTVD